MMHFWKIYPQKTDPTYTHYDRNKHHANRRDRQREQDRTDKKSLTFPLSSNIYSVIACYPDHQYDPPTPPRSHYPFISVEEAADAVSPQQRQTHSNSEKKSYRPRSASRSHSAKKTDTHQTEKSKEMHTSVAQTASQANSSPLRDSPSPNTFRANASDSDRTDRCRC